jgi:hypothetical protein
MVSSQLANISRILTDFENKPNWFLNMLALLHNLTIKSNFISSVYIIDI